MAATAEQLCHLSDVKHTLAPDAEAVLVCLGDLAQEDGRLHTGDADEVIDDAFAVFGFGRGRSRDRPE